MPAPDIVLKLCETFAEHREHFRSGNYNEFQLRKQFLDPLFEALGWDMANSQGLAPQYRDVIHEDAIKIGPHVKAPDYAFTLHGQRKFFLEAKKPSVNIKTDIAPAYQLRRYAWSAKLPLSILSDFEEFAIYDTRIKPAPGDASSKARTFYCTYDQYAEKWNEIAAIFSRDAILKGSFDKYADSAKKKKGTAEVDTAFLEEIERWRELLARNFALRNPSLTVRDLNFAVQKTIDRLVFLRICEDRGTEDYGRLRVVANGTQTYARLLELFRAADARYNSGLFHFSKEKSQAEEPDTLTPNLALDDKTLKDIIAHLYYPESPYEFSVLPADILGSVYERFLGKTIRLTDGHQAKIEEKPEVRKAGGVYYTPSYIVDYIVQNTLGKLLTPETDKHISLPDAAKLKVVDPACGSGSFLIVAYQFLLDWHRDRYAESPDKWSKGKNATLYQAKGGEWRLTTAEKKRILLNNIHGVDIDAAAVEVTKLSLLLKVLEGETGEIAQRDFLKERERILPDLANNIKCGNSLIGSDFYNQPEMDLLDDESRYSVNVFDWKTGFPEAINQGGFDVVIGNPPYDVMEKERGKATWPHDLLASYAKEHTTYTAAMGGKLNLFRFFVVRSIQLTKNKGRVGMIIPMSLLADISCAATRRYLFANINDLQTDCFPQKDNASRRVFRDAKLSTMIVHGSRQDSIPEENSRMHVRVYPWNSFEDQPRESTIRFVETRLLDPDNSPVPLVGEAQWKLCVKLHSNPNLRRLGEIQSFGVTRGEINQTIYREYIGDDNNKTRLLKGVEIGRYLQKDKLSQGFREWFDENAFLVNNRAKQVCDQRRIVTQRITGVDERLRVVATIVEPKCYFADSTNSIVRNADGPMAMEYLLAILNSKITQWRFKLTSSNNNVGTNELESLPIPVLDFANPADVEKHDRMVSLVDKMLTLVPKRRAEANPQAATQLDAQISATDRQIDRLVYELYGLTEEEIALVEGA